MDPRVTDRMVEAALAIWFRLREPKPLSTFRPESVAEMRAALAAALRVAGDG